MLHGGHVNPARPGPHVVDLSPPALCIRGRAGVQPATSGAARGLRFTYPGPLRGRPGLAFCVSGAASRTFSHVCIVLSLWCRAHAGIRGLRFAYPGSKRFAFLTTPAGPGPRPGTHPVWLLKV